MTTVFLSYRHENDAHSQRVRDLALNLRAKGVTVSLDALKNEEEFSMGGPDQGWLKWSYSQIDHNDRVLIIASKSYWEVYEGKAQPNEGVGAAVEANTIFNQLAYNKGINTRFRVVILHPGDETGIPDHLKDYHQFKPNERPHDFDHLVKWLTAAPASATAAAPAIPAAKPPRRTASITHGGPPVLLPTAASQYFGRADLVSKLATRLRKEKRTDVWGGPGIGKTALAAEAIASIIGHDAAELAHSPFPDGIVFLDLYLHKRDLDSAWHSLADAFDDTIPTDTKAADRAAAACEKRHALIILEGAEELGAQLSEFLNVIAKENIVLVLTRDESQTAAPRRIKLTESLEPGDALQLLRHLTGDEVPEPILAKIQALLGGHPLALTWAGCQLADADQPPANFLRDLTAAPFAKLTEPGGKPEHTLQWMFERSVRHMAAPTRTVLAAAARIAEPFGADFAEVAGGAEADLRRLVQLSFLRVTADAWRFAHALAAQYARALPLPADLLEKLGQWAIVGIAAADARCIAEGTGPLGIAIDHAVALLAHDGKERVLEGVSDALIYHDRDGNAVGIRRGRLDFARRAIDAVRNWQERATDEEKATPAWQRESSVSHNKLGNLAVAQGDLPGALRHFAADLAIAERLAAGDPANAAWQRDLSISHNKLGDLAVAQGDLPGALRRFTDALAIAERLAASDPANAEWQRDLSVSHERLGDMEQAQGNLAKAAEWFENSRANWQELIDRDSSDLGLQRGITVPLSRLGDLAVAQGDLPGALRRFTDFKIILERLAASDLANADWQRGLSVSHEKLGTLAVAQGDLAGALRRYTDSLAIRERLAASDPANAEWQRDLWVSYYRIADLSEKNGKAADAKGWWRKAHDTLASMKQRGLHLSPEDEGYLDWLRKKVAQ